MTSPSNQMVYAEARKKRKKIAKLEKRYEDAILKNQPIRAARIMRSFDNFINKPVKFFMKGSRPLVASQSGTQRRNHDRNK